MKHYVLPILLVMCLASQGPAAELNPVVGNNFPDLLEDSDENGTYGADLLPEEPYISDPVEVMDDPIFEDDFTLNEPRATIHDPLEPVNRVFFQFNDKLYFWVLKPTKNAYAAVLPKDIRQCVGNFFYNIASPVRFVNNVLQGEIDDAGVVLGRFLINSTLGVFGFGDAAAEDFNFQPRPADFGQTLGKWGIGEGIYLCWPVLGPKNVRDSFGFVGNYYLDPVPYMYDDSTLRITYAVVDKINGVSLRPDVYEELKRMSLDPYITARQAYYDIRRSFVNRR